MRLEGRRAVVVGVGSSIGRACAVTMAREGADVLCVDPSEVAAHEVARDVVAAGGRATPEVAELGTDQGADAVAERCAALWDRVDILVTCGALVDYWDSSVDADNTLDRWEEVIRVNLLGPVAYTRALLPLLRRSTAGSIVYLGSIDGLRGNPGIPAYSVSRGGLVTLARVMAHTGGRDGIRVNCVATGAIHPDGSNARGRALPPVDGQVMLEATPLGRRATPEDVASVVLFFASDDAAYVTGTTLPVDGGRTAITPATGQRRADPPAAGPSGAAD
jgi:NAD(P)-dependent dehydrogenase (short-subunit alcohol dehydrogenase family)